MAEKKKVCIDCGDEKPLSEFPNQIRYLTKNGHRPGYDGKRTECKLCHQRKNTKAYHKRTTPEFRKKYMREYMRNYNRVA